MGPYDPNMSYLQRKMTWTLVSAFSDGEFAPREIAFLDAIVYEFAYNASALGWFAKISAVGNVSVANYQHPQVRA